jgi:hypothetical protein
MTFVIKKISDHETSNPIVARMAVQTQEVVQFLNLEREKRDRVLDIYTGQSHEIQQNFNRLQVNRLARIRSYRQIALRSPTAQSSTTSQPASAYNDRGTRIQ